MDIHFTYDRPIAPAFHRCKWCRGDLTEVPPLGIVCGTEVIGQDPKATIKVHAWFCDKRCARDYYQAKIRKKGVLDDLNRYIKEIES